MTLEKLNEHYPTFTTPELRMTHIESRMGKWNIISQDYLLTEEFILNTYDFLYAEGLCTFQNLSDSLILRFLSAYIHVIVRYQKLSEQFISDNWEILKRHARQIANYQLLSPEFRDKYDLNQHINHKTNWLYWSDRKKANYIKKHTKYELYSDEQGQYILAYKGVEEDGYSKYNWQIQYKVGETYEPVNNCDCNSLELASSGLSAWYKQEALDYCNEKLLLVKIYLKDLGVIVKDDHRIRCRKLTVIEEVNITTI